ncbi:hypothetical protein M8J76_006651 [Diaphorina citri]|nr:hypothetical protein M8J75_007380 [Diaphorina citri]KAI5740744.1 hypothetical protein M8J76_006651 [Diaphorina citri]
MSSEQHQENTATTKPNVQLDQRQTEFSLYLTDSSIHETLVTILYQLYQDLTGPTRTEPKDPIAYVQDKLGDKRPPRSEINASLDVLNETRAEIEQLRQQIEDLEGNDNANA